MNNSVPVPNKVKLPWNAFSIITLFVVLIIIGIASIPYLSIQLEPSRASSSVAVNFSWPGASAALVEHQVTAKLEGALATVKGVNGISSSSSDGSGNIQANIDQQADKNQVRYEIATLMRQLYNRLPDGVSYPMVTADLQGSNGDENKSVLTYTVNGQGSPADIQRFVEHTIKPVLARLEGLAQINLYGATGYCWEFKYDPEKMVQYGVTTAEIADAISKYNREYGLGKVYVLNPLKPGVPDYSYLNLKVNTSKDIAWSSVFIKQSQGRNLFVSDVATVTYTLQKQQSFYRLNGLNTINMEIVAGKNSNYILLASQIKKQIAEIEQKLPSGYSLMLVYDATDFLKKEFDKIIWRSLATLIILLSFVLAVSRQLRYLLLILISLVANLLLAFMLYAVFKVEIHLYSLAAITISTGIMIDNTIVVIDHLQHKRNLRILLAVAGASLTTIGAVCIVFFLDKAQQVNLLDFAWVMILNIGLSLIISLLFIPALMEKLPLRQKRLSLNMQRKRIILKWNRFYLSAILIGIRFRPVFIGLIVLIFGLPFFLLPNRIEQETKWAKMYNYTLGSDFYTNNLRTWIDPWLGGTLHLFLSSSDQFSFSSDGMERTKLSVRISMPQGALLEHMDKVALSFENYLSQFPEIEQFQSRVMSGTLAFIDISFKKEFEKGSFPYSLKSQLETKAVFTGLADFQISGVGQGFNNALHMETTNYGLTIQGYNYEALYRFAEKTKRLLLKNPRVEKVVIGGERDYDGSKNSYEYVFNVSSPEKLLVNRISPGAVNAGLKGFSGSSQQAGGMIYNGSYTPLIMVPGKKESSMWQVMNEPVRSDSGTYVRLKALATMNKEMIGSKIVRQDQQYQLVINYNFIGDYYLGTVVSERVIKEVKASLPMGYTLKSDVHNFWHDAQEKLTWAIFLTIGIVFVICVILLNHIGQSLAVIVLVPISFIGVFLTSWIFKYKFDEGGYASFIILCGVVVSAALYILNDYNNYLNDYPSRPKRLLYLKAYSSKIIPVLLSRASIILGMAPFIVLSEKEPFWYPLAMSVTGGLLFSMVALLIFLPLFLKGLTVKEPIRKRKELW